MLMKRRECNFCMLFREGGCFFLPGEALVYIFHDYDTPWNGNKR